MRVEAFHFSAEPMRHPDEDALAWRGNKFAVFDGVTLAHQHPYPDPSPAAEAAKLGCGAILAAEMHRTSAEETLRAMGHAANQAIGQLNERLGITERTVDYLAKQYAAAVGAYGFIEDGTLYAAQLTDCEVMVLDASGAIQFRLDNDPGPGGSYMAVVRGQTGIRQGSPEEHQFVRKNIINNTALLFEGQPIRVGVFTGEPRAEQFVNFGQYNLRKGNTVLFYSDGMTPFIENPDFRAYLATADNFNNFDQHHRAFAPERNERSLIIVRPLAV